MSLRTQIGKRQLRPHLTLLIHNQVRQRPLHLLHHVRLQILHPPLPLINFTIRQTIQNLLRFPLIPSLNLLPRTHHILLHTTGRQHILNSRHYYVFDGLLEVYGEVVAGGRLRGTVNSRD